MYKRRKQQRTSSVPESNGSLPVKRTRPADHFEKENTNVKGNLKMLWATAFLLPAHLWAAGTGSAGLPWEAPLSLVARSLTGPVALSISIIAMMATGGALVFGGELHELTRRSCIAVLAIAFLVAGTSFMTNLFGVSGGLI